MNINVFLTFKKNLKYMYLYGRSLVSIQATKHATGG